MPKLIRYKKMLLLVSLLLLAVYLAACIALSQAMTQPANLKQQSAEQGLYRYPAGHKKLSDWMGVQSNPLEGYGLPYENVSFDAKDGSTLRGWFVAGASQKTIITVHGAGSDRRGFLRQLPYLHKAGYSVLLFDCREHGISDSQGRGVSFGVRESEDVLSAAAFLRDKKAINDIALFGTSQGAASVLIAASQDQRLAPVIAENPFLDIQTLLNESTYDGQNATIPDWLATPAATLRWHLSGGGNTPSPLAAANKINQPVFLLHSHADKLIAAYHSQHLFKALNGPKQQWYVDNARHSLLFNDNPERYKTKVTEFLSAYFPITQEEVLNPF